MPKMSKMPKVKVFCLFKMIVRLGLGPYRFFLKTCCKKLKVSGVSAQVSGLSTSVP
jgi:hypothetical protein